MNNLLAYFLGQITGVIITFPIIYFFLKYKINKYYKDNHGI